MNLLLSNQGHSVGFNKSNHINLFANYAIITGI